MSKRFWAAAGMLALSAGTALFFFRTTSSAPPAKTLPQQAVASIPSQTPAASVRTAHLKPPIRSKASSSENAWGAFSARFGPHLQASYGEGGRLVAVRGTPGKGEGAKDFSPNDAKKAIARAREVLDAAGELLGLDTRSPLGDPTARAGTVSAQVYFPQTQDGLAVAPFGSVTVDLGPQGELLNLSSDYVGPVPVDNQRSLSADQAKSRAEAATSGANAALSTQGGGAPIVWVSRSGPGGALVGRYAYDYNVAGRQIIVDAGNGEVLYRHDRRQF